MPVSEKTLIRGVEILSLLCNGLTFLSRPSFFTWDRLNDGWLTEHAMFRRLTHLEKRGLVVRSQNSAGWIMELTAEGRRHTQGPRDPQALWNRPWDGLWRQIIFDIPVAENAARVRLVRWLHQHYFGYLQDSVWITPDPIGKISKTLQSVNRNADMLAILESRCVAASTNMALTMAAWPFPRMMQFYRNYTNFLDAQRAILRGPQLHPRQIFQLLREESRLWSNALMTDPLLPRALWPKQYPGESAFRARESFFTALRRYIPNQERSQKF